MRKGRGSLSKADIADRPQCGFVHRWVEVRLGDERLRWENVLPCSGYWATGDFCGEPFRKWVYAQTSLQWKSTHPSVCLIRNPRSYNGKSTQCTGFLSYRNASRTVQAAYPFAVLSHASSNRMSLGFHVQRGARLANVAACRLSGGSLTRGGCDRGGNRGAPRVKRPLSRGSLCLCDARLLMSSSVVRPSSPRNAVE